MKECEMKCEKNKINNFGQVANEGKFNKKTKIRYKFTPLSIKCVFKNTRSRKRP